MSRTDKTKPWQVRVAEHHPTAHHDHRDGVCDLPADPRTPPVYRRGGCYWSDTVLMLRATCCVGCGCRECSGFYARRQERRHSRHQAVMAARRYVTGGEW